jgi:hypothetical protein
VLLLNDVEDMPAQTSALIANRLAQQRLGSEQASESLFQERRLVQTLECPPALVVTRAQRSIARLKLANLIDPCEKMVPVSQTIQETSGTI